MMENLNQELIKKAKKAGTADELLRLAEENGIKMTEEEAKAYFAQFCSSGELSDDELSNVAGGGCHASDGRLVVTVGYYCSHFGCKLCGGEGTTVLGGGGSEPGSVVCAHCGNSGVCCDQCSFCSYEKGLWLCGNPKNRR